MINNNKSNLRGCKAKAKIGIHFNLSRFKI